jgi:hypothetical protein
MTKRSNDEYGATGRPPRKPRSSERGAALFIVVLVTVLLSAIGIFAVRVASLVQVASGYNRRTTSAYYLAQLATNVALSMHSDDKVTIQNATMTTAQADCREIAAARAVAPPGTRIFCHVKDNAAIVDKLKVNNGGLGAGPVGDIARPDVPASQAVLPDVKVEITEAVLAPGFVAGSGQNTQTFSASYTATGHLYPATLGGVCGEDAARASSTTKLRAYVTYSM